MEIKYEPNFKIIYSLVDDEFGNQKLHCQTRDNFSIISDSNLGDIKEIVYSIKEKQQLKEELEKNEKMKQEAIELLKEFLCSEYYCSQGKELYDFCSDLGKILGMIKE